MSRSEVNNDAKFSSDGIEDTKNNNCHTHTPRQEESTRIIWLYNSKSGGQKASSLLKYLQAYTSLIYDLSELNSSHDKINQLSNDLSTYQDQLIICIVGGDGSQAWAASLIDRAIQSSTV